MTTRMSGLWKPYPVGIVTLMRVVKVPLKVCAIMTTIQVVDRYHAWRRQRKSKERGEVMRCWLTWHVAYLLKLTAV